MKEHLVLKNYIKTRIRDYIFLILTATILLIFLEKKSFSQENIFIIDEVEVSGRISTDFNREKFINKAFKDSYKILISKILLSKDVKKLTNIKLSKIKSLVDSFQITQENYKKSKYEAKFKIYFNDNKVKKFLIEKNISFSEPKNISAVFFPVFFINDILLDFNENYFYQNWIETKTKNEMINFILPIEDLEDFLKIKNMKNNVEMIDVKDLIKKYNTDNYVFALMESQKQKLNIYLRINFNNDEISKSIYYEVNDIYNKKELDVILKKIKMQITDIWKEQNIINLTIPLTLTVKYKHKKLSELDNLKDVFYEISIIDNFKLEEFNINQSFYKIYYYGSPKKLSNELFKFGYKLRNDKGSWEVLNK